MLREELREDEEIKENFPKIQLTQLHDIFYILKNSDIIEYFIF